MAGGIRKFKDFMDLPLELRTVIYNLAMEPRVIRALWELISTEERHIKVYHLAGGKVPGLLHATRETRTEALKRYTLVKAYRPLCGHKVNRSDSIFINFAIDTIYAVKPPEMYGFLSWLRRLVKAKDGGPAIGIRHLAFPVSMTTKICSHGETPKDATISKTAWTYWLCMKHPELESITIVMDNTKFSADKKPHSYSLLPLQLPINRKQGGTYGRIEWVYPAVDLTRDFFQQPFRGSLLAQERFTQFRESHPDWIEPSFPLKSIKKH